MPQIKQNPSGIFPSLPPALPGKRALFRLDGWGRERGRGALCLPARPVHGGFVLFIALLIAAGCGKGTESGQAFFPASGHPENWVSHLAVGSGDFHGTFIKSVLAAPNGPTLFALHCAPCHGTDASGKVGPDIRTLATVPIINGAVQNLPVMRGHSGLSQTDIQDIADYIATLAAGAQPLTGAFDTALCTQCHGAGLDGGIAEVSCVACHNGPDGSVGHPAEWQAGKDTPARYHGRYGRTFVSGCTTCHGVTLTGGIVLRSASGVAPACSSCHNGTIAPVL